MTKDWVRGVGHSPVCQIFSQIVMRAVVTFPPARTSSAWMLSTPADFPFFGYSGSNLFFLSTLLLSHRSRISAVFSLLFAKDLTGCFSNCCVGSGDHRSVSRVSKFASSLLMVRVANFPPIIAWKVSDTLGYNRFHSLYCLFLCLFSGCLCSQILLGLTFDRCHGNSHLHCCHSKTAIICLSGRMLI